MVADRRQFVFVVAARFDRRFVARETRVEDRRSRPEVIHSNVMKIEVEQIFYRCSRFKRGEILRGLKHGLKISMSLISQVG